MDLVFLGSPEEAAVCLKRLVGDGHRITLVVTRPDRRRGRGGATSPTPVKAVAVDLGLRVTHRLDDTAHSHADLGVVVAYGRLIPSSVLERLSMVNVHFSLLPRWRGAAPVERAILAGDTETGVCLMALDNGLDTGPLYACRRTAIGEDETAEQLRHRLAELGADMLSELLAGGLPLPEPVPQTGEPTYAEKLSAEDLKVCFDAPAADVVRRVRLGRAWTTFRGRRLGLRRARIEEATGPLPAPGTVSAAGVAAADAWVRPVDVVPEAGRPVPFEAWCHGARLAPGERLG